MSAAFQAVRPTKAVRNFPHQSYDSAKSNRETNKLSQWLSNRKGNSKPNFFVFYKFTRLYFFKIVHLQLENSSNFQVFHGNFLKFHQRFNWKSNLKSADLKSKLPIFIRTFKQEISDEANFNRVFIIICENFPLKMLIWNSFREIFIDFSKQKKFWKNEIQSILHQLWENTTNFLKQNLTSFLKFSSALKAKKSFL